MMLKESGENGRIFAHMRIDGKELKNVGVRYKGHSSYNNFVRSEIGKLPFNVKIDFKNNGQSLEGGITTIKLSNIFRDRSYVREFLFYEIASDYIPLPKITFAEIYVEGEYLGLYELVESIDDSFLERSFGTSEGVLFKCDPAWGTENPENCPIPENSSLQYLGQNPDCYKKWFELKSKKGWGDLVELSKTLGKKPQLVSQKLDILSTLWMLALNNVMVNLDSYTGVLCHNYYLFKPEGGKFIPLMWDFNLSFGAFRSSGIEKKYDKLGLQTMSPYVHYKQKNKKRPLITNLLAQDRYRKIYISMIKTILNDYFQNDKYLVLSNQFQTLISPSVQKEQDNIYSYADFTANLTGTIYTDQDSLIGISELMRSRTQYLSKHPSLQHVAPSFSELEWKNGTREIQISVSDADRVTFYYKRNDAQYFEEIEMQLEEDGYWTANDLPADISKFHFIAENAKAAKMHPEQSPWFSFSVN